MDNSDDGAPRAARFGAYEADFVTGELRKHGLRIKIQGKPLQVLQSLVERPGELVTRDELRARIWPADVYVDFDRNLKTAVNKLRSALCDSAESPRYIETLPRRGFRFIAPVELVKGNGAATGGTSAAVSTADATEPNSKAPPSAPTVPGHDEAQPHNPKGAMQGRWRWAAAALVAALLAVGGVFLHAHYHPAQASLKFHQRDWVLISQFRNLTRDPVLSGTVQYALTRELSNSRFISIVSPERIQDALALMKAPADAPLTRGLARQVCLRDGGIRALITGRVEKIGSNYVLSAAVVDPSTDTQVAGVEAQTRNLNGILPAVHGLSDHLRQALGETLPEIHASDLKLEKVSTPSLRALQYYSQAVPLMRQSSWRPAIPLLQQAVAHDPDFASAHNLLGWCYFQMGKPHQAAPHFEKALQLSGTASERERLFIRGSYYDVYKGDPAKAIQAYEALVRLYPDDFWGTNNLMNQLLDAGRWNELADMAAHRADLRPSDFITNVAAWDLLTMMSRFAEARRYFARAKSLQTPETRKDHPYETVDLASAGAESNLKSGNARAALQSTRRLAATFPAQTGPARNYLADEVGGLYEGVGKLKLAKEWFEKLPSDYDSRSLDFVELDEARGDVAGERRYLEKQFDNKEQLGPGTAMRLAQFGMFAKARYVIARMEGHHRPDEWISLAKGGLAFYEGRQSQAIPLLRKSIVEFRGYNTSQLSMAADLLATAYEQEGRTAEAIQTLQPLEKQHQLDLQASFHLFQLYKKAGDTENARKVAQNLQRRLAVADPDYPILVRLRRQAKLDASVRTSR